MLHVRLEEIELDFMNDYHSLKKKPLVPTISTIYKYRVLSLFSLPF
jgi:hypothetical protein